MRVRRASIPAAGYLHSYTHPPGPPFPDHPRHRGLGVVWGWGRHSIDLRKPRDGVEKNEFLRVGLDGGEGPHAVIRQA